MQWETGDGRLRAENRDDGSEMSDTQVGELPRVVATMWTVVAGGSW